MDCEAFYFVIQLIRLRSVLCLSLVGNVETLIVDLRCCQRFFFSIWNYCGLYWRMKNRWQVRTNDCQSINFTMNSNLGTVEKFKVHFINFQNIFQNPSKKMRHQTTQYQELPASNWRIKMSWLNYLLVDILSQKFENLMWIFSLLKCWKLDWNWKHVILYFFLFRVLLYFFVGWGLASLWWSWGLKIAPRNIWKFEPEQWITGTSEHSPCHSIPLIFVFHLIVVVTTW